MYFVATTLAGLEEVLSSELRDLGAEDIKSFQRAVRFKGSFALMYKANLNLRTALRILYELKSFPLRKESDLYDELFKMNWPVLFSPDKTISVHSAISTVVFNNSHYVSLKAKDAIADRFRKDTGRRPDVDTVNPDISIHIHIHDRRVDVSLDSSGIPLFKRGYRLNQHLAPLNEVLAAGMLLMSGWNGQSDFYDPMCGSGTLSVEAAMIAKGIPPGIMREKFSFMHWKDFDEGLFLRIRDSLMVSREFHHEILASDISPAAVEHAKENIRRARLEDLVKLSRKDFHTIGNVNQGSLIILNPPYGERISEADINDFYRKIGDSLKKNFSGSTAWILSGNPEALKFVGLKPDRKTDLLNAKIKCKYCRFVLFQGKREDFLSSGGSSGK